MRRFAASIAALSWVALSCSSFSSADGVGAGADGGTEAAVIGNAADASVDSASFALPAHGDPVMLATESGAGIAAAGDGVFWLLGPQRIRAIRALPDLAVVDFAPANGVTVSALGSDGASLFWLEHGSFGADVARVRRGTFGIVEIGTTAQSPYDLTVFAVGKTSVLAGNSNSSRSYAPGGAVGASVYQQLENPVLTSSAIIYTTAYRTLFETALSDGIQATLAFDLPDVSALVADEVYVYAELSNGTIVKIPHAARGVDAAASPPTTIATFDTRASASLFGDGSGGIFMWSDADHVLSRLSRDGGPPRPLLSDLHDVTSLAASARGIFWTTSTGTVMWLPF